MQVSTGGGKQVTPQSVPVSQTRRSVVAVMPPDGCAGRGGRGKQAGADLEGPRRGQAYIRAGPQPNTSAKKKPLALAGGRARLGRNANPYLGIGRERFRAR